MRNLDLDKGAIRGIKLLTCFGYTGKHRAYLDYSRYKKEAAPQLRTYKWKSNCEIDIVIRRSSATEISENEFEAPLSSDGGLLRGNFGHAERGPGGGTRPQRMRVD
ncbi:hypothetical protein Fcan01_28155 [Folsomia candida]|uniref:Uncharacterized protein n=1 Tax=Folsomia candida TaxID=158441 RepID=A0A226CUF0_FOLCA|nr:hypothetical protein Fcan01_28155 [Folsomia candida]